MVGSVIQDIPQSIRRRVRQRTLRLRPFYRTYPYRSPVPLSKADARGAIDHGLQVFYNRVPKAANSTIVHMLDLVRSGGSAEEGKAKGRFTRPSELSSAQIASLDGYFKFTFVRNPYSRVLSAYLSKIVTKRIFPRTLSAMSNEPTFTEFCHYLAGGGLHGNIHWAPQTSFVLLPVESFDFIGKVETIESDLSHALSSIGHNGQIQVPRIGPRTQANDQLSGYYCEESRALIAELYAMDFSAFGYEP